MYWYTINIWNLISIYLRIARSGGAHPRTFVDGNCGLCPHDVPSRCSVHTQKMCGHCYYNTCWLRPGKPLISKNIHVSVPLSFSLLPNHGSVAFKLVSSVVWLDCLMWRVRVSWLLNVDLEDSRLTSSFDIGALLIGRLGLVFSWVLVSGYISHSLVNNYIFVI